MKKCVLLLMITALLCAPSPCLSSYLIELKNGQAFLTSEYWEKNGQIQFYQFGGVIGLSRESILEIKETSIKYKDEIWQPKKTEPPVEAETTEAEAGTGSVPAEDKPATPSGNGYVLKEFAKLSDTFRSRQIMNSQQLREFHAQLRSLVKVITANRLIDTYEMQYDKLYRMIDTVEDIMARTPQ